MTLPKCFRDVGQSYSREDDASSVAVLQCFSKKAFCKSIQSALILRVLAQISEMSNPGQSFRSMLVKKLCVNCA